MPDPVCEEALVESRRARALERRGIVASLLGGKHVDAAWRGLEVDSARRDVAINPSSKHV
jgi:hypothetical protein